MIQGAAAGDFEVKDEILTIGGTAGYVLSFEIEKLAEPIPVYNIEVDDFHTYFVGDGNGWVLVHNQYKTGDLYESSFTTDDGITVPAAAEVVVDGKVIKLTNGVMYPEGGDMPNALGQKGLYTWIKRAMAEFKKEGFEKLIIESVRAEHSSSANPGSDWNFTIDLITGKRG